MPRGAKSDAKMMRRARNRDTEGRRRGSRWSLEAPGSGFAWPGGCRRVISRGMVTGAAAHRLPASELPAGPRRLGATRTRVFDSGAPHSVMAVHRGGQTRADSPGGTIMTQDKARKSAIRQRMAETGEPYSVARHAVIDTRDEPDPGVAAEAGVTADGQA